MVNEESKQHQPAATEFKTHINAAQETLPKSEQVVSQKAEDEEQQDEEFEVVKEKQKKDKKPTNNNKQAQHAKKGQ